MKLAPYDELNVLQARVESIGTTDSTAKQKRQDIEDLLWDILTLAYMYGCDDCNGMIGTEIEPDGERMVDVLTRNIAGMDFVDRIGQYVGADGTVDVNGITRLAESEMTRDYNEGAMDTAKASGKTVTKRWVTMRDGRVRDTHRPLDGVEIPLDEYFHTAGDQAQAPGGFSSAELNAGCRCFLRYRVSPQ